jgi:hypothetical protein
MLEHPGWGAQCRVVSLSAQLPKQPPRWPTQKSPSRSHFSSPIARSLVCPERLFSQPTAHQPALQLPQVPGSRAGSYHPVLVVLKCSGIEPAAEWDVPHGLGPENELLRGGSLPRFSQGGQLDFNLCRPHSTDYIHIYLPAGPRDPSSCPLIPDPPQALLPRTWCSPEDKLQASRPQHAGCPVLATHYRVQSPWPRDKLSCKEWRRLERTLLDQQALVTLAGNNAAAVVPKPCQVCVASPASAWP